MPAVTAGPEGAKSEHSIWLFETLQPTESCGTSTPTERAWTRQLVTDELSSAVELGVPSWMPMNHSPVTRQLSTRTLPPLSVKPIPSLGRPTTARLITSTSMSVCPSPAASMPNVCVALEFERSRPVTIVSVPPVVRSKPLSFQPVATSCWNVEVVLSITIA